MQSNRVHHFSTLARLGGVVSLGAVSALCVAGCGGEGIAPPAAGTPGDLGVMVIQKGDKPVTIMMKTHVSP